MKLSTDLYERMEIFSIDTSNEIESMDDLCEYFSVGFIESLNTRMISLWIHEYTFHLITVTPHSYSDGFWGTKWIKLGPTCPSARTADGQLTIGRAAKSNRARTRVIGQCLAWSLVLA